MNVQMAASESADWLWVDGTDGQEDELDDVAKGKLDAPSADDGARECFEPNKDDLALEREDEEELPPGYPPVN